MEFKWLELPIGDWLTLLEQGEGATLSQSWPYAKAAHAHHGVLPRFCALVHEGAMAGVAQIHVHKALSFLETAVLERGPIWFEGRGTGKDWRSFLGAFNTAFPDRLGQRRRLLPELPDGPDTRTVLSDAGFKRVQGGEVRVVLDLTPPLETLHEGLYPGWRNALAQASRAGLRVDLDLTADHLPWLLARPRLAIACPRQRRTRRPFFTTMAEEAAALEEMLLVRAFEGQQAVAAALFFFHGRSASYHLGWTDPRGEALGAMNLVLWAAVDQLKALGLQRVDLGEAPRQTALPKAAILGMGGQEARLVGEYA